MTNDQLRATLILALLEGDDVAAEQLYDLYLEEDFWPTPEKSREAVEWFKTVGRLHWTETDPGFKGAIGTFLRNQIEGADPVDGAE